MQEKSEPILELKDVSRIYDHGTSSVTALQAINLKIPKAKLIIIKGPSGSGKTTILNIVGGLDQPSSGQIFFNGRDLNTFSDKELTLWRRKQVGFIFQNFALIQTFTAFENVELPLRITRVSWKKRQERVNECLKVVGLNKRAKHRVFELSGGEQQRVGIARALANYPAIILADEPTAEVDYQTGLRILNFFKKLVDEQGITICMVTHDPAAMDFGDLVYELVDGEIVEKEVN